MRLGVLILVLVCCVMAGCNMPLKVQTPAAPKMSSVLVTTVAPSVAVTRTASPTPTAPLTLQPINAIRSTNCSPRTDWAIYIVAAGDTLGSIAQRTGTTVGLLAEANCLADANQIMAGQQLRIPYNSLDVPTPVGPPLPSGIRVGGQLTVAPVIGDEAGWLVLQAGSVVTITWPRAEQLGAVEVNFTLSPPGTGSTPVYIGTDINTADGVSIQWTVPSTGTQGYLEATAGTLGGRVLVDQTQIPLKVLAAPQNSGGGVQINSFTVSPNIELVCPFATIWFGCPITQQTVNLIYQPFERGICSRGAIRAKFMFYMPIPNNGSSLRTRGRESRSTRLCPKMVLFPAAAVSDPTARWVRSGGQITQSSRLVWDVAHLLKSNIRLPGKNIVGG